MPYRFIRHGIPSVWMLLVLTCAVEGAQMKRSTASAPASRPAAMTLRGTIKSIDPAKGEVKLGWRHQSREMEFLARLDAHVHVTVDGKPGKVSDVQPADRVVFTGQVKQVGGNMPFVVSRIDVYRQPATQPSGAGTEAEQILDRLEKKGDQVRDLQTKVTLTRNAPVSQGKQVYEGILRFKNQKPKPRFFIRLDKLTQGHVAGDNKEWHVFDGQWYLEASEKTKTLVRRQVRPGEWVDVFLLGQGPFPLPFGQKKSEIEKLFHVKLTPSRPDDPPNSAHLECTPKAGTILEKQYGRIDMYVDKQLDLPVRISATQKAGNVEVTVDFPASSIEVNRGLAGSELALPELKNYKVDTVPLGDSGKQ